MTGQNNKRLIILDLDHTLIYSTICQLENSKVLLKYSENIIIYERPYARELVKICHENADVIVFTTAVQSYAQKVCKELAIDYRDLYTRKDCRIVNEFFIKYVPDNFLTDYQQIIIIDDSPEVWDKKAHEKCTFWVPEAYSGNPEDKELRKIIMDLNANYFRK